MNYYNENDPKAAAWLRELIKEDLIPDGFVDERNVADVRAADLVEYSQCHFFVGIGGWSLALQLSGWPRDRQVWTGSCPCQPYSVAGKGEGDKDPRNLWPHFRRLINDGKPSVVFGEQVASKAGRGWLDGVRSDMEAMGYAIGAADLCAAGVNAPHIRQRLYWMAYANGGHSRSQREQRSGQHGLLAKSGSSGGLGDADGRGSEAGLSESTQREEGLSGVTDDSSGTRNPWHSFDFLPCTDGKSRRIEPGSFPLANGIPGRVGILRGYGNAIVPQVAAEFIQACEEAINVI